MGSAICTGIFNMTSDLQTEGELNEISVQVSPSHCLKINSIRHTYPGKNGQTRSRVILAYNDGALLTKQDNICVDRRKQVIDYNENIMPNSCLGVMMSEITRDHQRYELSGNAFLITRRLALTCAHNMVSIDPQTLEVIELTPKKLFLNLRGQVTLNHRKQIDHQSGLLIEQFQVNPKYIELTKKMAVQIKKMKQEKLSKEDEKQAQEEYYQTYMKSLQFDYSLLLLSEKAPPKKGLRLEVRKDLLYKKVTLQGRQTVSSYMDSAVISHIYHSGQIIDEKRYSVTYDVDTGIGQSGCPVLAIVNSQMTVIGIHKGYDSLSKHNVGTKITSAVIQDVEKWSEKWGSARFKWIEGEDVMSSGMQRIMSQCLRDQRNSLERQHRNSLQFEKLKTIAERDKVRELEKERTMIGGTSRPVSMQEPNPERYGQSKCIEWDQDHQGFGKFLIQGNLITSSSSMIRNTGENSYEMWPLIARHFLQKNSTTRFKVCKYFQGSMYFGFVRESFKKAKNKGEFLSGSLSYHTRSEYGQVCINGEEMTGYDSQLAVSERETLIMEVDLDQKKVKFLKNYKTLISESLPEAYSTEKVYMFAMMSAAGSSAKIE